MTGWRRTKGQREGGSTSQAAAELLKPVLAILLSPAPGAFDFQLETPDIALAHLGN